MIHQIFNKKGAMFGLDARIALAIFGALSVISGAALYSAIQSSKATAMLAEMREISKAWEQYLLDTSSIVSDSTGSLLKIKELVSNISSVNGWNGPYLSYVATSDYVLDHPTYRDIHLFQALDTENWGDAITWTAAGANEECLSGESNCHVWLQITNVPEIQTAKAIDELVDGGDGFSKGNFRVVTSQSSPNYYILKVASVANL